MIYNFICYFFHFLKIYRLIEGHVQDFTSLANYFRQFAADLLPMALSDFHVLLYLATNDVFCMKVCI